MPLTLAAMFSPQRRAPAARACLVLTLAGSSWFVARAQPLALDSDAPPQMVLDDAAGNLQQASENVERAHSDVAAARQRLDAFLARHFDPSRAEKSPDHEAPPPEPDSRALAVKARPNPELERLKSQLQELFVRRDELLGYLTDKHPEVAKVDGRIAAVQERISLLAEAALEAERQDQKQKSEAQRRWTKYSDRQRQRGEQDAVEYQELFTEWQSAQRALESALAAEKAAQVRLRASILRQPQVAASAAQASDDSQSDEPRADPDDASAMPSSQTGAGHSGDAAIVPGGPPSDTSSGGSQPLALAALLIALAVAALTAVRLARSTADPIFSSVDEVAAALAIPVVGIIAASATRRPPAQTGGSSRKRWVFGAQLIFAGCVFAVVAYGVQNPGDLWRHCTDPLQALGSLAQAIGGRN